MTLFTLLAIPAVSLSAGTVSIQGFLGSQLTFGSDGELLDYDNIVRVGALDEGVDLAAAAFDPAILERHWTFVWETEITPVIDLGEGQFSVFFDDSSFPPSLIGQRIWLWIYETSDNGPPAGDYSNVIGYGLFSSSGPEWTFPPDAPLDPSSNRILDTNKMDLILRGSVNEGLRLAPYTWLNRVALWGEEPFASDTGWRWLPWFGFFWDGFYPWIYLQEENLWIYRLGGAADNFWFYDFDLGWAWSAANTWPFVWSLEAGDFINLHGQ